MTHELSKMTAKSKKELAMKMLHEAELEERGEKINHPCQDTDFENPFNTCPPAIAKVNTKCLSTISK